MNNIEISSFFFFFHFFFCVVETFRHFSILAKVQNGKQKNQEMGNGRSKAAGKDARYLNNRRQIKPEGLSTKLNILRILWYMYINKVIFHQNEKRTWLFMKGGLEQKHLAHRTGAAAPITHALRALPVPYELQQSLHDSNTELSKTLLFSPTLLT